MRWYPILIPSNVSLPLYPASAAPHAFVDGPSGTGARREGPPPRVVPSNAYGGTSTVENGRSVECFLWGDGTHADPWCLVVRRVVADKADLGPGDPHASHPLPTIEEIAEAISWGTPQGAIFQFDILAVSRGDTDELECEGETRLVMLNDGGPGGVLVRQIGAASASAAERTAKITSRLLH